MTDWTTARVTPEKLAELRRLAEAATPGPWEAFGAVDGRRGERWLGVTTDMRATESARAGDVFSAQDCTRQDALFIAAANPAAVLALLDDADALRAELAHMREARDNARAEVKRLTAQVERVRALADEWTYKGEFGWDDGSHAYGTDCVVQALDYAAAELRRALDEEPQP